MTEAASLNFGPAWLRDSFHTGSGGGGGGPGSAQNSAENTKPYGSGGLQGIKLAEFRYGKEEMLALYCDQPNTDLLEALESSSLLAAGDRPVLPLNLMGDLSVEEQRTWQRGANSDQSLRIYSKQQDKGASLSGPRGGSSGGRGRGVGRGGGGAFFDRHDEDPGRGRGESEGRAFGGGRGRSYDRSSSWYDREDPGTNGSVSPRKGYSRAPFDDWRKPSSTNEGDEEGGWRSSGTGPSGRRWNAPSSSERTSWRSGEGGGEYRRDFVDGNSSSGLRWRDDGNSAEGYFNRRGGGRGGSTSFGRQRSRTDGQDLPEWAVDDDKAPPGGGTFDAIGNFREPSLSESPPPSKKDTYSANGSKEEDDWGANNQDIRADPSEQQFEDEEVDVDDLPPEIRKETLEQRQQKVEDKSEPPLMDDTMAGNLVSSLVDDEPEDTPLHHQLPQQQNQLPQQQQQLSQHQLSQQQHQLTQQQHRLTQQQLQQQQLTQQLQQQHLTQQVPQQVNQHLPQQVNQQLPQQMNQQLKQQEKPKYKDEDIQWFYLDPQGNMQGPFNHQDMQEWYKAGYFPRELRLRRSCDKVYIQLGEMAKLYEIHNRPIFEVGAFDNPPPPPLEDKPVAAPPPPQPSQQEEQQRQTLIGEINGVAEATQRVHLQIQNLAELHRQATASGNNHMTHLLSVKLQQLQQEQALHQNTLSGLMKALSLLPKKEQEASPTFQSSLSSSNALGGQESFNKNTFPSPEPINRQEPLLEQRPIEPVSYDPIKSLLNQLTGSDETPELQTAAAAAARPETSPRPERAIWDAPQQPQEEEERFQCPEPEPKQPSSGFWGQPEEEVRQEEEKIKVDKQENSSRTMETLETTNQHPKEPKKNESKKEKKNKRAKDDKRSNKKANEPPQKYIPGMEGSVRPEEQIVSNLAEEERQRAQAEALQRLQAEQQAMLEREQAAQQAAAEKQRQEAIQSASRLAPWAKKSQELQECSVNGGGVPGSESTGLSLSEIQKMEEEREREMRTQREFQEQQMREIRRKEEEESAKRQQNRAMNWANTATATGGSKSLAEIQAEETAKERERQEMEKQQKRARQKEMGLARASVWGSASSNLSWASKAATSAPAQSHAAPNPSPKNNKTAWGSNGGDQGGFWEEVQVSSAPTKSGNSNNNSKSKKVMNAQSKKAKEDAKVASIFREQKKPANEFEAWCSQALQSLHAQIDIPTFMAFLNDIESPFEVNDYVKSYIGEGKGPKNFAKEYMERRSRWKNSLKSAPTPEDDLLTPAQAINPQTDEFGFQSVQANGGKKRKGKGGGNKKMDASHLLGFSVSSSDRVNAGDIDHPQ